RRDIRLLTGPVSFARYADRQKFPPQGLFGGRPGAPGAIIRNPGAPDEERMRSKALDTLAEGDVVSLRQPGAGGYGDPRERDLAAIDRDLLDGKVTPEGAERDYDAVVDRAAMRVDRAATAALRARTGGAAVAAE
ncbi:MAG: hydantoinase B/oxoprolinase family protein, partial [Rhodospirillaceae bacterium]|nr:hydantoinase B/oxoprolinase family protein [Rhodospirillaceae bacterium]